jgi:serine/threonine protein kinase
VRRPLKHQKGQAGQGQTFPGYANVVEIGSGAFAAVYRATETGTGRPVALKVLNRLSLHLTEAFDREVKALGALGAHPNIVSLYRTVTTSDGRPVLVLELCRCSMAERLRQQGPLPVVEAVSVGIKIAGALETAHRAGLLQRDMKPQNILITQYGEPVLADFGVAARPTSAPAAEGVFGFTTVHAPPEILEGRTLSPATDVYGMASTLYQLIAGQAPFAAFDGEAPAAVILRILRDPVAPLRLAEVPLELSDLLQQALAKAPADRPPSAAAFARELQGIERLYGWGATSLVVYSEPIAARPRGSGTVAAVPDQPLPALGSAPAPVTPSVVVAPTDDRPVRSSPPPVPDRVRAARPGIVIPAGAHRNVVAPASSPPRTGTGLSQPAVSQPAVSQPAVSAPAVLSPHVPTPTPAPAPPPAPAVRPPAAPAPAAERPIFVDPPAVPWDRPAMAASPSPSPGPGDGPYDQTLSYGGLTAALKANLELTAPSPSPDQPRRGRWLWLAGAGAVAIAMVVILVALLTGLL